MSLADLSLLLAALGGTCVTMSWRGRRTGDSRADVWLLFGTGSSLLATSCAMFLLE